MRKQLSILAAVAMLGFAAPAAADDFRFRFDFGQPATHSTEVHTVQRDSISKGAHLHGPVEAALFLARSTIPLPTLDLQ